MAEEFRGKVAVVTGGGAGIGLAAARKLAQEGTSVVICSDREDQAAQAAGGLREEGLEVMGMRGDVTSSKDMKDLVDFAVETYGGLDALVNVSSVQAIASQRGVAAYTASKGGINALTRAMATDHAEENIRVNAVCPGSVDTPMLRWAADLFRGEDTVEATVEDWGRMHPLGRVADRKRSPK